MTSLTLRAVKAKAGDCLLLHASDTVVLIDGGPSGVYRNSLKKEISRLPSVPGQPKHIDLLMVSHIDADHVVGLLNLTEELIAAEREHSRGSVDISEAWHNSFEDAIADVLVEGMSSTGDVQPASVASAASSIPGFNLPEDGGMMVLASVGQGRQLTDDLKTLVVKRNHRFQDKFVALGNRSGDWTKGPMTIEVIGPTKKELDDLRKRWKRDLKKILAKEEGAKVAAAGLDTSVTNIASIVAIAKAGGKSVLLTGDARGDNILDWLEASGKIETGGKIHFNILKLPHHGSDRNVNLEFFEKVTADHYVVSGNGGHGNPEPETFRMLFQARPDLDYEIHMTYGFDELANSRTYVNHGNLQEMEHIFADPDKMAILRFPSKGATSIEICV